jgi:hypothetical protein
MPLVSRSLLSTILFPFFPFMCIHQCSSRYPTRVSFRSKISRNFFSHMFENTFCLYVSLNLAVIILHILRRRWAGPVTGMGELTNA